MYKIFFRKKVHKFLKKHSWEKIIFNLEKAIDVLKVNPYINHLDIKLLTWEKDKFRLRLWKYRFIYEIFKDKLIITFTDWDNRWWIYK